MNGNLVGDKKQAEGSLFKMESKENSSELCTCVTKLQSTSTSASA